MATQQQYTTGGVPLIANPDGTFHAGTPPTTNPILTPDQIAPAQPLNLDSTQPSTPAPNTSPADGLIAGVKTYQDYLKEVTPPKTDAQNQADTLTGAINDLLPSDTGKGAATVAAEAAAGVPDYTKQLADLNTQILSRTADYEKQYTDAEKNAAGATTFAVTGYQSAVKKAEASDIGLLQARALGLQGQLQTAKDTAQRAVDLKYQDIEDQINTKMKQLQLLQPTLTADEKRQADALNLQLQDQQQAIADEKAKVKDNLNLALTNGVQTEFVNHNGEFFNARTGQAYSQATDFFKAAGVSNFAEAYQKGLVTDVANALPKRDTQIVETNGRKVLIDTQTGATISDLGAATTGNTSTPNGPGSVAFTATDKQALLAAGFTAKEISQIQSDVNIYGINKVTQGLSTTQANAIKKVLGGGANSTPFLTTDFFKQQYGSSLEQTAKDAGYVTKGGGFLGTGFDRGTYADTDAYLKHLMSLVESYRAAGYNDQDILKMMQ